MLTPLSAFAPQTARRPNTPGNALALAAGLPPSPVVLDADADADPDVEDIDEERPDAENTENEPIPRAKAKPMTSIDSPAPPTRARRSLTAYFQ